MELPSGEKQLALLPTKFNKLIWMKRGDYVIVTESEGQFTTASGKQNGVSSLIQHILMKDQIQYIKKQGLWPKEWEEAESVAVETVKEEKKEKDDKEKEEEGVEVEQEEEKEEEEDSDSDFGLEENPNRRRFYVESDDDDDDDDDDSD